MCSGKESSRKNIIIKGSVKQKCCGRRVMNDYVSPVLDEKSAPSCAEQRITENLGNNLGFPCFSITLFFLLPRIYTDFVLSLALNIAAKNVALADGKYFYQAIDFSYENVPLAFPARSIMVK